MLQHFIMNGMSFHNVGGVSLLVAHPGNSNSLTLAIDQHRGDDVWARTELTVFMASREAYDALVAALPKADDFRLVEEAA